jgi:hypothetical protein
VSAAVIAGLSPIIGRFGSKQLVYTVNAPCFAATKIDSHKNKHNMNIRALFLFGIFATALSFVSCTKSNDDPQPNNPQTPASGLWKVSYFFDQQETTSNYTNYTFDFSAGGVLTVKNGSQTWLGTWTTGSDDSKNKFVIAFSGSVPSAFSDLAEDWLIVSMTNTDMHFEHVSGGNGGTRVLKFTKI